MPRPLKLITSENIHLLKKQLERLLGNKEKAELAINGNYAVAKSAFESIGDSPKDLNVWVTKWLTPNARTRMWSTLRQKTFRRKHEIRVLTISDEAYGILRDFAKRHQVTFSNAIECLTQKGVVMGKDYQDEIRLIVDSLKLQQQCLVSLYNFCEGKKEDKHTCDPDRREALEMRAKQCTTKMQRMIDELNKNIENLDAKLQSSDN